MDKSHGVDDHMASERRKTFVAREDLLKAISEIARENGKSLYETVNEIFETVISFQKSGIKMQDAMEACIKLKKFKESGYVLCLENLWNEINLLAYHACPAEVLESWRTSGMWLAKRHSTKNAQNPLESIQSELKSSIWNASEFVMREDGGSIYLELINPRLSKEHSNIMLAFFEGVISGLGFEVSEKESQIGGLRIVGRKV
uniref:Uncharacterized protein n=1 Tax=Candidatus Methanosuratincola petrocarbonis (ex Vanwonterghem et al. 2016) TaxID=1867261 RepID=A0A7J3UZU8_9CREN